MQNEPCQGNKAQNKQFKAYLSHKIMQILYLYITSITTNNILHLKNINLGFHLNIHSKQNHTI